MSKSEREHYAYQYGTDAQFLDFTAKQKSVIDEDFNQFNPNLNIPCHVRRIKRGAGGGKKPPYSAVAMTDAQHRIQTLYGEAAVLNAYKVEGKIWTDEEATEWFEARADENLENFIEFRKAKISLKRPIAPEGLWF
jgi:hypothetical protein